MSDTAGNPRELEVHETFGIASEFAPHVTTTEETFFGHGWQPLTISVLQAIWFLPADITFDVPFLVSWFERIGWKGANGKPLGANVVRRELGFLRDAGYLTVNRLRGEGGQAVGIQYTISKRRSDQPEAGAWIPASPSETQNPRSHHMSPLPTCGESPHVGNGETRRSDHMSPMTTRGESPHVADDANLQVAPRATNGFSPHSPLGGGTTPPPTPSDGDPSQTEEEESLRFTDEQLAEAQNFLGQLPGDWFVGQEDAKRIAPKLLTVLDERGWALAEDGEMLTAVLTKNPGGIRNHVSVLESKRIPNLIPRTKYRAKGPKSPGKGPARPADGLSAVECTRGCDDGYVDVDDRLAPCECLPLRQATRA